MKDLVMTKSLIDGYAGGPVDRALVTTALDFMVSIQPASQDPDGGEKYRAARIEHADTITKAESIFRSFGASIEPQTQEAMEDVLEGLVNSRRYGGSVESASCVRSCLGRAWRGIGTWQN